jgi:hypothetical protein
MCTYMHRFRMNRLPQHTCGQSSNTNKRTAQTAPRRPPLSPPSPPPPPLWPPSTRPSTSDRPPTPGRAAAPGAGQACVGQCRHGRRRPRPCGDRSHGGGRACGWDGDGDGDWDGSVSVGCGVIEEMKEKVGFTHSSRSSNSTARGPVAVSKVKPLYSFWMFWIWMPLSFVCVSGCVVW